MNMIFHRTGNCRSQWPRGLRRRSAAARLLRLWVRIPPGAWMFVVSVVCCQVDVSATSWSLVQRSPTDCGLSRRSTAARLLRSWVRIPPGEWMIVFCDCCVLSGRGLCDELITRPDESYRLWCVVVCDLETLKMRRSWSALGRSATGKKKHNYMKIFAWRNREKPGKLFGKEFYKMRKEIVPT